jgi:2-phosphosulfolactate phosphatase
MDIHIYQLLEGAKQAKGLAVVIDVFRAFSLACYAINNGAKEIIPIDDIEKAYELKKQHPEYILIGERNERIPPGFDYGNSPTHILNVDFTGKTLVHSTSAGTRGLINASGAYERLTGSFVNAPAVVSYIKQKNPQTVSLVCMGYSANYPTEEDTFCAEYIKNSLEEKAVDYQEMMNIIKDTSGKRLFNPENSEHSPQSDFYLCTDLGRFDFILKAETDSSGLLKLKKLIENR